MSKTFTDAIGTSTQDSIFEQAAQITKAHAYDIVSQQVKELQAENAILRDQVKYLQDLIKEFTGKMLKNLNS